MIRTYECVVLFSEKLNLFDFKKKLLILNKIILNYKAEIFRIENWGLRKLAYIILENKFAYYSIIYFKLDSNIIVLLKEILKNNNDIIRWVLFKCNLSRLNKIYLENNILNIKLPIYEKKQ